MAGSTSMSKLGKPRAVLALDHTSALGFRQLVDTCGGRVRAFSNSPGHPQAPPNYPLRDPKYHLIETIDHKSLNRGTLGGVGTSPQLWE